MAVPQLEWTQVPDWRDTSGPSSPAFPSLHSDRSFPVRRSARRSWSSPGLAGRPPGLRRRADHRTARCTDGYGRALCNLCAWQRYARGAPRYSTLSMSADGIGYFGKRRPSGAVALKLRQGGQRPKSQAWSPPSSARGYRRWSGGWPRTGCVTASWSRVSGEIAVCFVTSQSKLPVARIHLSRQHVTRVPPPPLRLCSHGRAFVPSPWWSGRTVEFLSPEASTQYFHTRV